MSDNIRHQVEQLACSVLAFLFGIGLNNCLLHSYIDVKIGMGCLFVSQLLTKAICCSYLFGNRGREGGGRQQDKDEATNSIGFESSNDSSMFEMFSLSLCLLGNEAICILSIQ